MIQLSNLNLFQTAHDKLNNWQQTVDNIADYSKRVDDAKKLFARYNKANNPTFRHVRQVLTQICSGARRCAYCEDSVADEVEHIKPKDLYPEAVFVWENYLYACGPCNAPKNNKFAIFSYATDQFTNVTRKSRDPVAEPEAGEPVLINPRIENPLDLLQLDLMGTFYFLPHLSLDSRSRQRAEYTIEVLRLNDRDYLVEARAEAFDSYRARLFEYTTRKSTGTSQNQLNDLIKALQRMQHPTVWREMQRQQPIISTLKELFNLAPEALTW